MNYNLQGIKKLNLFLEIPLLSNIILYFDFDDLKNHDILNTNLQLGFLIFSFLTFFILFFIPAYYGRFNNRRKFMMLSDRFAWVFQESPCVYISCYFLYKFISNENFILSFYNLYKIVLVIFFIIHYIHRSLIFPFKIHSKEKKWPIELSFMAFSFCLANSTLQARSILNFVHSEKDESFFYFLQENYLRLSMGLFLYVIGMALNITHDYYILETKKINQGYFIPDYFLFNFVSCPNYLGELIEWLGFAMMAHTFSSYLFVFSTFANLFPRAISTHNWYKMKFENYPKKRKAIIPFII